MTTPTESWHLATLIETTLAEKGWSQRELARRSHLPAPTVQKIVSRTALTVPRRSTLESLANGLGVPLTTLLEAAAKDSGYRALPTSPDESISAVVAAMEELPPARRAEIAALAMAMLATERQS